MHINVMLQIVAAIFLFHLYSSRESMMSLRARNLSSHALSGQGRNAVVVGATSGIGEGCALRLAEAGYSVTAVGRDLKRGEAVVEAMNKIGGGGTHDFVSCDAFALKNIEKCAQTILNKKKNIDVLVLSQGMATIQGFTPTVDGNDQKLTLHYWGRMAMITQLLPSLRQSSEARVVSVLSGGVHGPFSGYKTDPELRKRCLFFSFFSFLYIYFFVSTPSNYITFLSYINISNMHVYMPTYE
jgi:NAD(P)-dependent dehydrogenase (short-subunit alcohol dehydrogenase family)